MTSSNRTALAAVVGEPAEVGTLEAPVAIVPEAELEVVPEVEVLVDSQIEVNDQLRIVG